ncbi:MAG TPA: hypothetical protein VLH56_19400 [Dissulfurispiraceae bacterium]|nr:hypothetical protein [Dissulfurispiraceae bacterium]
METTNCYWCNKLEWVELMVPVSGTCGYGFACKECAAKHPDEPVDDDDTEASHD